jgi:AraC-like DNA-binding protein
MHEPAGPLTSPAKPEAPDHTAIRFATDQFPLRDQLPIWREMVGRTICKVDIEPRTAEHFSSSATLRVLPGLGIMSAACSALSYVRTRQLLDSDDVILTAVLCGAGQTAQCGRSVVLDRGDATLLSTAHVGSYDVPTGGRHIGLRVPRAALAPFVKDIDNAVCRPIPAETPALQLLLHYIAVVDETEAWDASLQHHVVAHVHDLMALTIGATRDSAEVAKEHGARAARLCAIKQDIASRLDQPDLSVGAIAALRRCTPRYIQALFEREGTTFTEYVLAQRLARAYRLLTDPRRAHEKISAVAYDSGFANLSYFNRAFRGRFGASPSDLRAQRHAEAPIGMQ